jgi:hypothetical protein
MKQIDKELLLKDIYARIPYGVKGCFEGETFRTTPLHWYAEHTLEFSVNYNVIKNGWRPYLFPPSSMTDEQKDEYHNTCNVGLTRWGDESYYATDESIDWLNAHHIDYRGLIEKGLAIDATGLNVY